MSEEVSRSERIDTTWRGVASKRMLSWLLVGLLVLVVAAWIVDVNPAELFGADAREQLWLFVAEGFPPDTSQSYLVGESLRGGLLWAVVETLAISVVGTVMAVALAIPLALAAAAPVTHDGPLYARSSRVRVLGGRGLYALTRWLLSFLRSVPGLVWGFLFVTAVGLGPFAGALALGIHNAGVLGKLYADFLEDSDPLVVEAVATSGGSRLAAILHGLLPQQSATMVSYTLYRWECVLRSATILGFVGAGGIGYYLVISIQRLQYQKLLTAIGAVFILVVATDTVSGRLRSRLT
jgi:phosphonate transport system permease protein